MMSRGEAEEALALIRRVVSQVHDETVLQNWGRVMIIMGSLDLIAFGVTQVLARLTVYHWLPYALTWAIYLALGLAVNLGVRTRMGGSMTYVERHIWGNGLTFYAASFAIVALDCLFLDPPRALGIIPAHCAVIGAVSFAFMALVDNRFFLYTAVFFATAALLGVWPDFGFGVLGAVWFVCLGVPGWQYIRERRRLVAVESWTEVL